jgi:hypothetical protein
VLGAKNEMLHRASKLDGFFGICKTVILPVVLYGCEIWSLTLREEHRSGTLYDKTLRIFGRKREEVTGG